MDLKPSDLAAAKLVAIMRLEPAAPVNGQPAPEPETLADVYEVDSVMRYTLQGPAVRLVNACRARHVPYVLVVTAIDDWNCVYKLTGSRDGIEKMTNRLKDLYPVAGYDTRRSGLRYKGKGLWKAEVTRSRGS